MKRLVFCLLFVLLPNLTVADPLTQSAGTEPNGLITGHQVLDELVRGRTQYGLRSDGSNDVEYHAEDGTSAYWYWGCLYRGRWWATEENICYYYPALDVPGPHCFTVTRQDDQLQFWAAGGADTAPTVVITKTVDGNPENFPLNTDLVCDEVS